MTNLSPRTIIPFLGVDQREYRKLFALGSASYRFWETTQKRTLKYKKYIPKLNGRSLSSDAKTALKNNFTNQYSGLRLDNLAGVLCTILGQHHDKGTTSRTKRYTKDDFCKIIGCLDFSPLIQFEEETGVTSVRDEYNELLSELLKDHPFGSILFGDDWVLIIDGDSGEETAEANKEASKEEFEALTQKSNKADNPHSATSTTRRIWKYIRFLISVLFILGVFIGASYFFINDNNPPKSILKNNNDGEWVPMKQSNPSLYTKPNITIVGSLKAKDQKYDLGYQFFQRFEDYMKHRGSRLFELNYISLSEIDKYPINIPLWRSRFRDSIADAHNADILLHSFGLDKERLELYCHYYPRSINFSDTFIHDSLLYDDRHFLKPALCDIYLVFGSQPTFRDEHIGGVLNIFEDLMYSINNLSDTTEYCYISRFAFVNETGLDLGIKEFEFGILKDLE